MNIKMSTDEQTTSILQMVIIGVTIVSLVASEILPFIEKIKPNGIVHGIVLALSNIKTRERNASTRQGG